MVVGTKVEAPARMEDGAVDLTGDEVAAESADDTAAGIKGSAVAVGTKAEAAALNSCFLASRLVARSASAVTGDARASRDADAIGDAGVIGDAEAIGDGGAIGEGGAVGEGGVVGDGGAMVDNGIPGVESDAFWRTISGLSSCCWHSPGAEVEVCASFFVKSGGVILTIGFSPSASFFSALCGCSPGTWVDILVMSTSAVSASFESSSGAQPNPSTAFSSPASSMTTEPSLIPLSTLAKCPLNSSSSNSASRFASSNSASGTRELIDSRVLSWRFFWRSVCRRVFRSAFASVAPLSSSNASVFHQSSCT